MSTNAQRDATTCHRAPIEFHAMPGARHFRAADLATWPDAQRRYRELVHCRHPDRVVGTAADAARSEFIEITAAFKRLRERYRRDGSLPVAPPPAASSFDEAGPSGSVRPATMPAEELARWCGRTGPGKSTCRASASAASPSGARVRARSRRRTRAALAVGAAMSALLALLALGLSLEAATERDNRDLERRLERTR